MPLMPIDEIGQIMRVKERLKHIPVAKYLPLWQWLTMRRNMIKGRRKCRRPRRTTIEEIAFDFGAETGDTVNNQIRK